MAFRPTAPTPQEVNGRWRYNFAPWSMHYGVHPNVAPDRFLLGAVGVDGRVQGVLRSFPGMIFMESTSRRRVPFYNSSPTAYAVTLFPRPTTTWWQNTYPFENPFAEVYPFEIGTHGDATDKTLKGFVFRIYDSTGGFTPDAAAHYVIAIVTYWDEEGTHSGRNLRDQLSATDSRFSLVLPRVPEAVLLETPSAYWGTDPVSPVRHYNDLSPHKTAVPQFVQYAKCIVADDPIRVTYNARFLYIFSTTGEFDPITIWYDDNADYYSSTQSPNWHWEKMGPVIEGWGGEPQTDTPTVGASSSGWARPAVTSTGHNYYSLQYRLYDNFRNRWTRLSNRAEFTIDKSTTTRPDLTFNLARWNAAGNTVTAGGIYTGIDYRDFEAYLNYLHYDFVSSLAGDEPGGTPYLVDTLTLNTGGSRANREIQLRTDANRFGQLTAFDTTTSDIATAGGTDTLFCTDDGIAARTEVVNPLFDEPGGPPNRVLAAATYQGLTVLATDKVSQNDNRNETAYLTYVDSSHVVLRWSAADRIAYEMFPAFNEHRTKLASTGPVAFVQASDYLCLFGTGQMVRIQRSAAGPFLEILEMGAGFDLVSENAVTEVKGAIFGVFRSGVMFVEPASGTPTRIEALDRLMRDTWATDYDEISVAYDALLDAVFILNPYHDTAVVLWFQTQRITQFELAGFQRVMEANVMGTKRAVFMTPTGRFVYPAAYDLEDPFGSRTMYGLTTTGTFSGTAKFNYQQSGVIVDNVSYYSVTLTNAYEALSEESPETGGTYTNPENYLSGIYLVIASGEYTGTALRCSHVSASGADAVCRIPALEFEQYIADPVTTILAGTWWSVSPVPFGVLGAPLDLAGVADPTRKRHVKGGHVIFTDMQGRAPFDTAGFPLGQVGVVDPDDVRAYEPMEADFYPKFWFRHNSGSVGQDRTTTVPVNNQVWSVDDPSRMFWYQAATGHLLFPYFRSFVSDIRFELQELAVDGTIVQSDSTVANSSI